MTLSRQWATLTLANVVLGAAIGLGVTLDASVAEAARVAPLPPRIDPPGSSEVRDRLHEALARGLSAGGGGGSDVVQAVDVRGRLLGAGLDANGCAAPACFTQAARELRADRVAVADISVTGKNYVMTLRLLDQGGAEMWRTVERCDVCSLREADEAVVRAAGRMAPWVGRPGPTDQAEAQARSKAQAQAAASPPSPQPTAAPTAPAVATGPLTARPPERPRWTFYRYAWVSALVIGGLGVAGSIPFWAYAAREDEATCPAPTERRNCPTVYRGNLGAALGLLIGVGVGVGGGGFAAFYTLDRREQRRAAAQLSLQPVPGGGLLSVEGRFF